jgi:lipid II:glycine glycyltransferase (peptidoglycan interpeptide bridge formation enzyme)
MCKAKYRELSHTEESLPIFARDWWLDAVCGADWEALLYEENGRIVAAMPLFMPVRRIITMPDYTQTMGIWFAAKTPDTKYASVIEQRQAVCRRFIENLGKQKFFMQNFSCEFTDWLPFYWKGFHQTTRYTYILHNIKDIDSLFENMSRQTRRNIKRAENRQIRVKEGILIDEFLKIQKKTFERQKIKDIQSSATLTKLITATQQRAQGMLFGGYDADGRLHAAVFITWQKSAAYYIAGGGDPQLRNSGAYSLVMLEAIKYASQFTDTFDFEGSMIPGVERFFREFGAIQTPYFSINKGKLGLIDRIKIKIKHNK